MTPSERRAAENKSLLARMRKGEDLSRCSPQDTWWPSRPIIKKDAAEVARALGLEPRQPRLVDMGDQHGD